VAARALPVEGAGYSRIRRLLPSLFAGLLFTSHKPFLYLLSQEAAVCV
jgi:hypothetical protein